MLSLLVPHLALVPICSTGAYPPGGVRTQYPPGGVRSRTTAPLLGLKRTASDTPFRVAYDASSEVEQDTEYEVDNLLFVGMVRTMRDGNGLLSPAVLLGTAAGLIKLVLSIAFVFRFYVAEVSTTAHWLSTFALCPTWFDQAGLVAALIAAPAFLLHALTSTSEFKDTAVMWATLQKLNEQHRRKLLYVLWMAVHVLRAYVILPCFILANAGLLAHKAAGVTSGGAFEGLLGSVFAAKLIFEIDGVFYDLHTRLVGKIPHANACVRLGAKTQALCNRVVQWNVLVLGIAQLGLVVLMKTGLNKGLNLLWSMPLIAAALVHPRAYDLFPNYSRSNAHTDH